LLNLVGSPMNVAVLVSGQMRTAEHCATGIRSIYPDVPFVVHAAADADADKAFLFRPAVTVIETQPEMPERREYTWQSGRGNHGVQRTLKQLWSFKRTWQAFEASGIEADVVVRCRADLLFVVEPEQATPAFTVPAFANWWGLNDRFAWGSRDVMRRYFNRLDVLDEYIDQGGVFQSESFLEWAMRDVPVKRTRAVTVSLRSDGTRDEPVWLAECGDVLP
jgi:hypothetical protein